MEKVDDTFKRWQSILAVLFMLGGAGFGAMSMFYTKAQALVSEQYTKERFANIELRLIRETTLLNAKIKNQNKSFDRWFRVMCATAVDNQWSTAKAVCGAEK